MEPVHDHPSLPRHRPQAVCQRAGLRRLTPAMAAAERLGDQYAPDAAPTTPPYRYLAALKDAAPDAGIPARLVAAIDWLFHFTQPQDWQAGSRPIVWPSAQAQAEHFRLAPSQVKRLNRSLIEHGLMLPVDSPNGRRYGRRDQAGRIIEAYGFDLSPIAVRYSEFVEIVAQARERRDRFNTLRKRITRARKRLRAALATALEHELPGDWTALAALITDPSPRWGTPSTADLIGMERSARDLEIAADTATARLSAALDAVERNPEGRTDAPHHYNYKPKPDPNQDTVAALRECSGEAVAQVGPPAASPAPEGGGSTATTRADRGSCSTITPDELVRLAPQLLPFLTTSAPRWPEIIEAADWLRHHLGVSKSLWGEACLAMGRERAAIALAIVSTKPADHFRSGPGGYFRGMVTKALAGELHLERTIWALRRTTTPQPLVSKCH